jgi:hypothetical protein
MYSLLSPGQLELLCGSAAKWSIPQAENYRRCLVDPNGERFSSLLISRIICGEIGQYCDSFG